MLKAPKFWYQKKIGILSIVFIPLTILNFGFHPRYFFVKVLSNLKLPSSYFFDLFKLKSYLILIFVLKSTSKKFLIMTKSPKDNLFVFNKDDYPTYYIESF